jgi:hypothetical protein
VGLTHSGSVGVCDVKRTVLSFTGIFNACVTISLSGGILGLLGEDALAVVVCAVCGEQPVGLFAHDVFLG